MISPERIHYRKEGSQGRGDRVVYWMQRSQRAEENHALEYAVNEANLRQIPLNVVFCIDPEYPLATSHSFRFMVEGLAETRNNLLERGIPLSLMTGDSIHEVPRFVQDAALLVVDRGYLRHERQIRNAVAEQTGCQVIEVESDCVVPVRAASLKEEWSAATLRRKLNPQVSHFLHLTEKIELKTDSLNDIDDSDQILSDPDRLLKQIGFFDPPKILFARGGRSEALKRLSAFLATPVTLYDRTRNDPGVEVTSGLSPYLHFGQISPLEVARAAAGRAGFLEELIVRRELAINFVWYNEKYDQIDCLPDWALKTLGEHRDDLREYTYSLEELRHAETHDPFWNAAQKEMLLTGRMHNYMRMYWGKKILEWSDTPEIAYQNTIQLNDIYELDGRDPNGYAGVAWCFGKHDRAWKERPVYGKVRYMNANGLLRKGDIRGYVEKVEELETMLDDQTGI
ncbi:deoxyribodipyrimidine photolyase [Methanocalculus taiwanensis]|uniref:Deoxyribodipyrimidine photo-lyase n=1 Tax=Methanocalculus taiwanensis TaxID=106207 RepID=A0ABD4TI53_9EURY|nr:deoxyribodipyrimidine photo-lyase [Methanocalculus taiwanensis]MCQ1537623.1 deoxyribodipyrimidine photolyase [Methanocalculus taiwanensis]